MLITISWVFFRSPNWLSVQTVFESLFGLNGSFYLPLSVQPVLVKFGASEFFVYKGYIHLNNISQFLLLCGSMFVATMIPRSMFLFQFANVDRTVKYGSITDKYFVWRPTIAWSLAIGLLAGGIFTQLGAAQSFIYFQF